MWYSNMRFTIIAGISLGLAGFLSAQSAYDAIHILDRETGFGSRAMALGGAYTVLADDYTALYWNPAGLGKIKEHSFYTELSNLNFNNGALFSGTPTTDTQTYTRLRSVGVAIPLPTSRGSFVLALGYNRAADFDENLHFSGYSTLSNAIEFNIPDDNDVSQYYLFDKNVQREEQISSEGGLGQWSFGGAIALSPRVLLGITAALWSGKEEYRFRFTQTDVNNLYQQYPADFSNYQVNQYLQSRYTAWNLKIGGLIDLSHGLKVGGTITLPSNFKVEEAHSFSDKLHFDDGYSDATDNSGEWDYRVITPYSFDGGLAYSSRMITLTGSVRYRDWSQTRFDVHFSDYDEADYRTFLEENDYIRLNYRSTMEYHLGGEIALSGLRTKLRGGYAYYPSPLKGESKDRDRLLFSGGAHFTIDEYVGVDFTYLRSSWVRETNDSYTPGGTVEDILLNKILIGFSYKF